MLLAAQLQVEEGIAELPKPRAHAAVTRRCTAEGQGGEVKVRLRLDTGRQHLVHTELILCTGDAIPYR